MRIRLLDCNLTFSIKMGVAHRLQLGQKIQSLAKCINTYGYTLSALLESDSLFGRTVEPVLVDPSMINGLII